MKVQLLSPGLKFCSPQTFLELHSKTVFSSTSEVAGDLFEELKKKMLVNP